MPKLIRVTTAPISLNVLLRNQPRYMKKHGFDVVMVSSDGPELQRVIQNENCRHHIIPMTRRMTPFADVGCLWKMYRFFKREKPDIVHSHTPKGGLIAMLAARMAGVRIRIHTVAGLRFMTTTGTSRKVLVAMEKLTARAATHVWPNSYSLLEYIRANKLAKPRKLEVIGKGSSNGVDLRRYSKSVLDPAKLEGTKKLVSYDSRLTYFLSIGRLVHDKGIDELVHAFSSIYEQHPETRLILVGAFEDEVDPVSDETKKILNIHPGIIMAGWSDAVEYFLAFSFALIHPSHREGFPNVLLQAGAMECPIICSRIEGNVDIVEDGKTGLIFNVKHTKALYAQMGFALANPAIITALAANLRNIIERHFDQPAVHEALRLRYLQLLPSGASPA